MIEVEKKFNLSGEEISRLTQDAEYLGERVYTDTYIDTPDYFLTRNDIWLRSRDGKFELKLPMKGSEASNGRLDQFREIDTEREIMELMQLNPCGTLQETLEANGYVPFAIINTVRKKYQKGDFIIDLDGTDFGYNIGEIERMVDDPSQMEDAVQQILDFSQVHSLTIAPVRGKVIEYVRRNNPDHYNALLEAGVI